METNGCEEQHAALLRTFLCRAAVALRAGPVPAHLREAVDRHDWVGALAAWEAWLRAVGTYTREWEIAGALMVRTVETVGDEGSSRRRPADVLAAEAERRMVAAVAERNPGELSRAFAAWMLHAMTAVNARRRDEAWWEFVAGLPVVPPREMVQFPAAEAAEHVAITLQLAAEHGEDMFFPPNPPKEMG